MILRYVCNGPMLFWGTIERKSFADKWPPGPFRRPPPPAAKARKRACGGDPLPQAGGGKESTARASPMLDGGSDFAGKKSQRGAVFGWGARFIRFAGPESDSDAAGHWGRAPNTGRAGPPGS